MQPLHGIRVIEFCQIAAGPFAAMLLADQGADVINVESPEGDGMRGWPPHRGGYSENFASLNRNKRSVVLDLKDPAELAADARFASTALRAQNQVALKDLLEAQFAGLTAAECLAIMRKQAVPCAPINRYSEALADPWVAHYGWVQPLELPGRASTRSFLSPLGRPDALRRRSPRSASIPRKS